MFNDPQMLMSHQEAVQKIKDLNEKLEETKDGAERTRLYYEIMLKGLWLTEPVF